MSANGASKRRIAIRDAAIILVLVALAGIFVFYAHTVRQYFRELRMRQVTSAHYEVVCPTGPISQENMSQFATHRDSLFTMLDTKLGGAGSNTKLRIIFDPDFSTSATEASSVEPYAVTGTTIQTKLIDSRLQLDPAADAEALLHVAWGPPGNARVAQWTAIALVGEWRGEELGMAAAGAEQKLGHEKLSALLDSRSNEISSPQDRALLGGAWVSAIVEFGGPAEVRKLYSAKAPVFDEAEAAKELGTTSAELERKWQLWMYSYLAGMPSAAHSMPMVMPNQ